MIHLTRKKKTLKTTMMELKAEFNSTCTVRFATDNPGDNTAHKHSTLYTQAGCGMVQPVWWLYAFTRDPDALICTLNTSLLKFGWYIWNTYFQVTTCIYQVAVSKVVIMLLYIFKSFLFNFWITQNVLWKYCCSHFLLVLLRHSILFILNV